MTLDEVMELAGREQFLAVVATVRDDSTVQSSLVNAGVLDHPVTGEPVAGLRHVRRRQVAQPSGQASGRRHVQVRLVVGDRRGQRRADRARRPEPGDRRRALRLLLRDMFTAAGGQHDDWDTYDKTMLEQRRVAVFIDPTRIYSN